MIHKIAEKNFWIIFSTRKCGYRYKIIFQIGSMNLIIYIKKFKFHISPYKNKIGLLSNKIKS